MHEAAGRLMLGQGILPGADKPPTIILASFFNIFLIFLYYIIVSFSRRLKLGACGLDFGYLVRLYILMVVYERLLVASGGSVHSCAHKRDSGPAYCV